MDREKQYPWSNGHNAWNYIHRRFATKGMQSLKTLDFIMKTFVEEINREIQEHKLNALSFMRKLTSSIETRYPDSHLEASLDIASIAQITNTNYGNPRGRRSNKRARSHIEVKPRLRKKGKLNEGVRTTSKRDLGPADIAKTLFSAMGEIQPGS